jgi:hypothetical protein
MSKQRSSTWRQRSCPYYRIAQRVTHGSAMWADTAWLKSERFAQEFTASPATADTRSTKDKIVLSNVREGNETRDVIWKLALSRSPARR